MQLPKKVHARVDVVRAMPSKFRQVLVQHAVSFKPCPEIQSVLHHFHNDLAVDAPQRSSNTLDELVQSTPMCPVCGQNLP